MQRSSDGLLYVGSIVCAAAISFGLMRLNPIDPLPQQAAAAPPPAPELPQLPSLPKLPELPQLPKPQIPNPIEQPQTMEQKLKAAAMRVPGLQVLTDEGDTAFCGSFPIAPDILATAAHCVDGVNLTIVPPGGGEWLAGEVIKFEPEKDLALVQVAGANFEPFPLADAKVGEQVYAIGYPGGYQLTVTGSQVVALESPCKAEITCIQFPPGMLRPGNSGGPILNERMEAIGVAHALNGTTGDGLAVPSHYLK